jgi:hypothetical protein
MTDAVYGRKSGKWTVMTNPGVAISTNSRVTQIFLAMDSGYDDHKPG